MHQRTTVKTTTAYLRGTQLGTGHGGSIPRPGTMNTEMIKLAAKALMVDTKGRWGNWEFNWELIRELHEITEDSEFPVGMEEVESVLIALTKLS